MRLGGEGPHNAVRYTRTGSSPARTSPFQKLLAMSCIGEAQGSSCSKPDSNAVHAQSVFLAKSSYRRVFPGIPMTTGSSAKASKDRDKASQETCSRFGRIHRASAQLHPRARHCSPNRCWCARSVWLHRSVPLLPAQVMQQSLNLVSWHRVYMLTPSPPLRCVLPTDTS